MACPGGCIGGGGQPKDIMRKMRTKSARAALLPSTGGTSAMTLRTSHENPEIIEVYEDLLRPAPQRAG